MEQQEIDLSKNLWTFDGVGRQEFVYIVELDDEEIENLWEQFRDWNGSHYDFYFKFVNPECKEVSKIGLKKQEKLEKTKQTMKNKKKK